MEVFIPENATAVSDNSLFISDCAGGAPPNSMEVEIIDESIVSLTKSVLIPVEYEDNTLSN